LQNLKSNLHRLSHYRPFIVLKAGAAASVWELEAGGVPFILLCAVAGRHSCYIPLKKPMHVDLSIWPHTECMRYETATVMGIVLYLGWCWVWRNSYPLSST